MIVKVKTRNNYAFFLTLLTGLIGSLSTSCNKESAVTPSSVQAATPAFTAHSIEAVSSAITTGSITCEEWANITGNDVSDIPTGTTPTSTATITTLEKSITTTANYGRRIRGYVTAPQTGKYSFWLAGDDAAELWLSPSTDPSQKTKIVSLSSWTDFRDWHKFTSQRSADITLTAGQHYYIEVLHKQGGGNGHVSVAWGLPNNTTECPIQGSHLSPYGSIAATSSTAAATAAATSGSIAYTASGVLNYTNAHDITISGKAIAGGSVPAITLTNCHNIHITNCKLYNSTDVGIYLYNCHEITIDYNYFTNVSTGVYVDQAPAGAIVVNYNQFLNMQGPFPRGQFVQFNNVKGAGSSVSYNKGENILGQSHAEDAISMYQSSGTASSPVQIVGNWIRGGGPSASGGGIMLGDQGGDYLYAANNILVNPGEYGMAITGGDHNSLVNNTIYGVSQSFTNVGLYVNSIGGYNETNSTVSGNKINFINNNNYPNPCWLAPGVSKPSGWDTSNSWGILSVLSSILPVNILTYK